MIFRNDGGRIPMKVTRLRGSSGQVLVLVALALLVIVALVALAVDGGGLYAARRQMQNAADAGALAGARQLCFESDTSFAAVEAVARQYASTLNGADEDDVDVTMVDYNVTVVAGITVDTFFAGVMGFRQVPVAASATAMCSQASEGDNLFPLGAYDPTYSSLSCNQETGEGEYIWIFAGTTSTTKYYCEDDPNLPNPLGDPKEDDFKLCDCGDVSAFGGPGGAPVTGHLGPGDRGWLLFYEPPPPYESPVNYLGSCGGGSATNFWIVNGHPGPYRVGDCIPGQSGVVASAEGPVDTYKSLDPDDRIRNVVLYTQGCNSCDDSPPVSTQCCGGNGLSYYRVSGFGCVEIIEYIKNVELSAIPGYYHGSSKCKFDVVIARKRCGEVCNAATGSGSGVIPEPDAVRAVRLIR
jgi:hypothetical protein